MEPKQILHKLLSLMVGRDASDLFITVGFPPSVKVDGEIVPIMESPLSREQSLAIVEASMNVEQHQKFHSGREANFAIAVPDLGRFRISAFWQRDSAGLVARRIQTEIPEVEALGLPPILKDIVMSKRGLFLFVGATGTGKSTSMASLLGYRNRNSRGHILSIEDPIEFVHKHAKSVVTQREVGIDTDSFDNALKSALRQAPAVIMIGEIRSMETMEYAITFSETVTCVWPPCTPTTPTKRWTASCTWCRRRRKASCCSTCHSTCAPLSPSSWYHGVMAMAGGRPLR